jgi:hypothetical protein
MSFNFFLLLRVVSFGLIMTVGCEMDDQMTFPPIGWLCYLKIGLGLLWHVAWA